MSIGTTIKKLRRAKDLTQEELAESLGITAKAVSQWECDRTAPDISQLPALCNLFEVTADQLLGIDIEAKQKRIEEIYDAAYAVACSGDHRKSIEMWLRGIEQFPDSYRLMAQYVSEVSIYSYMLEDKTAHEERALAYIDRILAGCTDSRIRNDTITCACIWYSRNGRTEEARKMADCLPDTFTKMDALQIIFTGKMKHNQRQMNILYHFTQACSDIADFALSRDDDGNPIYTDDEKLRLYEKQIALFKLFFEDGDYMFHAQFMEAPYHYAAHIYAERNDTENMLKAADAAADFAILFDTYDPEAAHTSLGARGQVAGDVWWHDTHNRSYELMQTFLGEPYSAYRENTEFQKILEKLEKIAR